MKFESVTYRQYFILSLPGLLVFIGTLPIAVSLAFDLGEDTIDFWDVFFTATSFCLMLWICLMNIAVSYRDDGIEYKLSPFFLRKHIKTNDIQSITYEKVSALWDFGGWGYRMAGGKRAIIMKGNDTILIKRKNGQRDLYLGAPKEIAREIEQAFNSQKL